MGVAGNLAAKVRLREERDSCLSVTSSCPSHSSNYTEDSTWGTSSLHPRDRKQEKTASTGVRRLPCSERPGGIFSAGLETALPPCKKPV